MDLSSITSAVNAVSDIILVNPKKDVGITAQKTADDSFLFHIKGEEVVSLTSDVTDHFVEDNSSLQDQVSLKPETVTTAGYIGELNNVTPVPLEILKEVAERLQTLSPFVPALSSAALIAYNNAAQLYAIGNKTKDALVSAWGTINGNGTAVQNEQQIAFNKFYGWWKNHQLFTVQTPWCIFDDMIIMSLRATQGEDTRMITDFEITFKKMRFAKTLLSKKKKQSSGRAAADSADQINNGTTQPKVSIGVVAQIKALGLVTH